MSTMDGPILIQRRIFDIVILNEGFINFRIRPNITCELSDALDYIQASISLQQVLNGAYPVITTVDGMIILTKEAKHFIRSYSAIDFYIANAIVVEKVFLRGMMRLIMTLIPSNGFPEEIFPTLETGTNWLVHQNNVDKWTLPEQDIRALRNQLTEHFETELSILKSKYEFQD